MVTLPDERNFGNLMDMVERYVQKKNNKEKATETETETKTEKFTAFV